MCGAECGDERGFAVIVERFWLKVSEMDGLRACPVLVGRRSARG